MDINKALGIAKNLKNHFKAFEELEEFIKEVCASQALMNEIEPRKAALQGEIEALEEQKAELSEAIEAMKPIAQETEKAQGVLDGLKDEIASIKAKLG